MWLRQEAVQVLYSLLMPTLICVCVNARSPRSAHGGLACIFASGWTTRCHRHAMMPARYRAASDWLCQECEHHFIPSSRSSPTQFHTQRFFLCQHLHTDLLSSSCKHQLRSIQKPTQRKWGVSDVENVCTQVS